MSPTLRARPWLFTLLLAASCGERPARFADRPAVIEASDAAPSRVPRSSRAPDEGDLFDARLRRAVVGSLDTARIPDAGDINALDDVPTSTWFANERLAEAGPPVLPLAAVAGPPSSGLGGLAVVDARGVRYELRRDRPGAPAVSTANEAISAGLLRALGYRTAPVYVVDLAPSDQPGGLESRSTTPLRVSATHWPPGLDLGPTPLSSFRRDDPNDRIPHPDRRTLRALREVSAWLMIGRLDARRLRDVYVGEAGRGHVEHFVLGSGDGILADVVAVTSNGRRRFRNAAAELFTLGLQARPVAPRSRMASDVAPEDYVLEPPWEPLERALPADSFWIARRMMSIPRARIDSIVAHAGIASAAERGEVARVLDVRRRSIAARAFAAVTPCSWIGQERAALLFRDEAVAAGFWSARRTRYRVELLDDDGDEVAPPFVVRAETERLRLTLPMATVGKRDRLIVRLTVERGGQLAPRPLEVHLATTSGGARVIGLRY